MPLRLTAKITGKIDNPKVKHYLGLPAELTGAEGTRIQLDWPSLLVIEEKKDGIFLFRLTSDGRCVGDTWHQSVDEAQQQANFEFESLLSRWTTVPIEISDVVAFGLSTDD